MLNTESKAPSDKESDAAKVNLQKPDESQKKPETPESKPSPALARKSTLSKPKSTLQPIKEEPSKEDLPKQDSKSMPEIVKNDSKVKQPESKLETTEKKEPGIAKDPEGLKKEDEQKIQPTKQAELPPKNQVPEIGYDDAENQGLTARSNQPLMNRLTELPPDNQPPESLLDLTANDDNREATDHAESTIEKQKEEAEKPAENIEFMNVKIHKPEDEKKFEADFNNLEVNNYWRLKKLEEQEENSSDPDDDQQNDLDEDSDDSNGKKEELKNIMDEGVVKKMIDAKADKQDQSKDIKNMNKSLKMSEDEKKLKKDEERKMMKQTQQKDFNNSQDQYKAYLNHRQRFNTNEAKQKVRRQQFEPDEDKTKAEIGVEAQSKDQKKEKEEEENNNDDDEKQKDGEDDDGGNNETEYPSLDFKKMLKNDKRQKTLDLPFTNTQVEDVIFLKPREEVIFNPEHSERPKTERESKTVQIQEVISLQCNFYMTDCYYFNMEENTNGQVNRMGTENYEVSDWDNALKKSSFDKVHKNLVINKKQSYTGKMKDRQMTPTENKEALVEYYLTKWKVNESGGMKMIKQSKYFKMDGTFKEHDRDNMELQLNEDGSYIFITQNDKANVLPLKIKVWDVMDLKEHNDCVLEFQGKLDELKERELDRLDLIISNTYMVVGYQDKEHQDHENFSSCLQKYQVISKDMLKKQDSRDDVFTFNPFFAKDKDEPHLFPQSKVKVDEKLSQNEEFIFPIKIFLDSKQVNKDNGITYSSETQMSEINFMVLFLLNKTYKYTDSNGKVADGYPWTLISVSMQQLYDWTTEQVKLKNKQHLMNKLCVHAREKFFNEFYKNLKEFSEKSNGAIDKISDKDKQYNRLGGFNLSKFVNKLEGTLFMLPSDWIKWSEDWTKNPLIFSDIRVNVSLDQVSWNNKELREFLVYNEKFSGMKNLFCPMNSVKYSAQSQGVIESIKNQQLKKHIRCVYKGLGSDTTIYSFFHEDIDNNLKIFKIQDDYEKADLDCNIIFQTKEKKEKGHSKVKDKDDKHYLNKFQNYQIGVVTIRNFTQNIIYKIFKPEQRIQKMKALHQRQSVGQVFNAQYPCLATNLGLNKICIQINLNKLSPKALIYDWNKEEEEDGHEDHEAHDDQQDDANNYQGEIKQANSDNYEIFVGFVNYNTFSDLGLDERHICIDVCARFAYLTRKPSEDNHFDGKEKVYLNILIVDAYNPIPQVVHFKSIKIFDFRTQDIFEDVIKENLIYKAGDEIHLMTQFPRAIHHAILTTDLTEDALGEDNQGDQADHQSNLGSQVSKGLNGKFLFNKGNADNRSQTSKQIKLFEKEKQATDKLLLKEQKESLEKIRKALFKKLSGQIITVTLIQDLNPENCSVYFAMKSKEFENFIEIFQFDPTQDKKNTVKVILTLRKKNLLVFEQMKDGSFFIIDDQGIIGIYNFNGAMLERTDFLYMHPEDVQKVKKFGEFTRVIANREVMIAPRFVFYLFENRDSIVPGVLMSENLLDTIQSDYNFDCVDGPIRYKGQDAFINMYCYKDSQDEQVFYFRQIIYRMPNSAKKNLVNDFNKVCNLSTFLESEDILCSFGSKFLQFTKDGFPRNEINFKGHPTNFLGETPYTYSDKVYIVAYWHQFKCESDDGICKQIFVLNDEDIKENEKDEVFQFDLDNMDAKNSLQERYSRNTAFKAAKDLFAKKTKRDVTQDNKTNDILEENQNEQNGPSPLIKKASIEDPQVKKKQHLTPGVLVLVDRNRGLCFLDHQIKGSFWHQKCVIKANQEYHHRMELVSISDNSKYFLFCDLFLQTFSVWKHSDKSHQMVEKYLKKASENLKEKLTNTASLMSSGTSFRKNSDKTDDYNKQSKPKKHKLKNYPEKDNPPEKLPVKSRNRYIKRFLRIVQLTHGCKISPSHVTNSLANHQLPNILNGNKTKFIAQDIALAQDQEFCLTLKFDKPQLVSAFGLRSANNYPHLDPAHIRIEIKLDQQQRHTDGNKPKSDASTDSSSFIGSVASFVGSAVKDDDKTEEKPHEFQKCIEVDDLQFKYRSQMLYFIKPNPWEFVKEIKVFVLKNRLTKVNEDIEKNESDKRQIESNKPLDLLNNNPSLGKNKAPLSFQLAEIQVLEKMEFFDFQFTKIMDLVTWKQEPVEIQNKEMPDKKSWSLQGVDTMSIFKDLAESETANQFYDFKEFDTFDKNIQKKIAFLRQDNVTKQIIIERETNAEGIKVDKTLKVVFGHCNHNLKCKDIELLGSIFQLNLEEHFKQKGGLGEKQSMNIWQVEPIVNFKKLIPYEKEEKEEEIPIIKHFQRKILKLEEENEKFVLQQLALQSYQRELNTIYKNQEKIRKQIYKFSKMISVKFGQDIFMIKKSQSIQYGKMEELENTTYQKVGHNFKKKNPMDKISPYNVLDQQKVTKLKFKLPQASEWSQTSIQNVYFTRENNLIQILAVDFLKNLLIMATWDIEKDYETNMLQIKNTSEESDMADLVVLKGIRNKNNTKKGAFNYILSQDTFIDLENNIPFMYSEVNSENNENEDTHLKKQNTNPKKIFKDSSRFLSPYARHQLVYCNTQKDIQLWHDVLNKSNRKAAIRKSMNIIDAFRIQYHGMSLFHHFANDQQIIKLVHQEYMQAKEQDLFENDSQTDMPLFILCPDDKKQFKAMQLAIKHQKPTNFEYMVSMLKDFDHICSSKMMLGNFNEMMTLGFGQILEYFDKSQFNPPMLSTPFVIEWPDNLEEFPFVSSTSLLSQEILQKEVDKQMRYSLDRFYKKVNSCFKKFNLFNKLSKFISEFRSKKTEEKFALDIKNDGADVVQRRIQVQALDFDWIFDGNNAENFLKLLELKGTEELFNQKSIQQFIQLMWDMYQYKIMFGPLRQYILNLTYLILLTSVGAFNYMEHLPICNDLDDIDPLQINLSFGTPGDDCVGGAQKKKLNKLWIGNAVLIIMTIYFILLNLMRELKQIYHIGSPMDYITSLWNLFDMFQIIVETIYILFLGDVLLHRKEHETGITDRHLMHMRTAGALVIFLKWMKFFYWGKLFKTSAYFIVQLYETVSAMKGFIFLLFICIIAFTNFFMIIAKNKREEEAGYVTNFVENNFVSALLSIYLLSLGEFAELDGYKEGHDRQLAWVMFVLGTLIIQLVFMNMLIAVMSTPFSIVMEKETLFRYKQQLSIIVDYIDHVDINTKFSKLKYIMVIKPEEISVDDGGNDKDMIIDQLRDTLKSDRKNNDRQFAKLTDLMEKQISSTKIQNDESEKQTEEAQTDKQ